MNNFCVYLTLLVLIAFSLPASSQAPEPADSARQEAPVDKAAKRPRMPTVITFESSVGNVNFPHRKHQKMGCQKCHHQIHAKELHIPHESYLTYSWVSCPECHNEDSETSTRYYGCGRCHHSNLANIADETLSAKVVLHKNCWKCHLSGTGAQASEKCAFCHEKEEKPQAVSLSPPNPENLADTAGPAADAATE